jgi:hypothetical protein
MSLPLWHCVQALLAQLMLVVVLFTAARSTVASEFMPIWKDYMQFFLPCHDPKYPNFLSLDIGSHRTPFHVSTAVL